MKFKGILASIIVLIMLCTMSISTLANDSRSYEIELAVNGNHEVQASAGDVLTVTMTLKRTDSKDDAKMYAMQDEIRYDPAFFEVVEGSAMMMSGMEVTDVKLIDGYHAFYVNFLSMNGGESWKADTLLGSFQIKVLGDKGSSMLKNENCLVSKKNGSGSYEVAKKDLLVIVSSECTVKFDSMGGSTVEEQTVLFGEKINQPENPTRDGYRFNGWYSDIYLKNEWDFDRDVVTDNMTLYASWQKGNTIGNFEFLWMILLIILLVIIIVWWIYRKRKKKEA